MVESSNEFEVISACRSCGFGDLAPLLDLGHMPLADALVPPGFDRANERMFPLTLVRCPDCSLVQILETVSPHALFGNDYPYFSSVSDALVEHARRNVEGIIERTRVDTGSLVVELASNDGYLLQWFAKHDVPVLGVEPTPGPAASAREKGIPTLGEFFTLELANELLIQHRQADVIIGNNVLAHVPDQNEFVEAMEKLLAPGGTIVMEFPYVRDLITKTEFDTIYHEHACYFSVTSAQRLFARHGLQLVRVEHHAIHGGSLRVFVERDTAPEPSVDDFTANEKALGMLEHGFYEDFASKVEGVRSELGTMVDRLCGDNQRVAAYGAGAKGAILLNYCELGADRVQYVVDKNPHKHGMEMPGRPVPIKPVEHLQNDQPDITLLLTWNFLDEIRRQQSDYLEAGGQFLIPLPSPTLQ